ncbi:MAG TPA: hypothetical protein VLB68_28475 [Pyrinomonadaceae bacterium]|nr:hypothetical protein [Pyrinomonadaceae bacterium]
MRATLSTIALLASCLAFSNCADKRDSAMELINHKASLTGDLPFNPFGFPRLENLSAKPESSKQLK